MELQPIKFPLGALSRIEAETFGKPGQRTFRLVLEAGAARCLVWVEKDQLAQIAVYLQEVMDALSEEDRKKQSQAGEPEWSGPIMSLDFKAGQMMLSHEPAANAFYFRAYEVEDPEASRELSSISFWIGMEQAQVLARQAVEICAAGRPTCFLCGLPINPEGHICPKSNGHVVIDRG